MGDTYHEAHMMVQAELDKEREEMNTRYQTDAYRLERSFPNAFVLVRKRDNASAYFQGDDAELWDRNMTAIEAVTKWGSAQPRGLDGAFDFLCSGYDDVLSLPLTHEAIAHATVQHEGRRMNGGRTIDAVLASPSASDWLKNALRAALVRDCVDAANDADELASLLRGHAETALRKNGRPL